MRSTTLLLSGITGLALGIAATLFHISTPRLVIAGSNDRHGDFAMATGAVSINPRVQTDGVWLLDYRTGKLLGTVIDKSIGKIVGWAEVDLTSEFEVKPLQEVHFVMTTGYITQGQSALYVAETTTGKFGVYTMGPGANGSGMVIRRHDMTNFRQSPTPAAVPGVAPANAPAMVPASGVVPAATTGFPVPAGMMPAAAAPGFPIAPQAGLPAPAVAPVAAPAVAMPAPPQPTAFLPK